MAHLRLCLALIIVATFYCTVAMAKSPPAVAVAPAKVTGGVSSEWMGDVIAMRAVPGLLDAGVLTMTFRQVEAARRQVDLSRDALVEPSVAVRLGRLLGASLMVHSHLGSGTAPGSGAGLRLDVNLVDVTTGKVRAKHVLRAGEGDLQGLVDELVALVCRELKVTRPGASGKNRPRSMLGLRHLALGAEPLRSQSLSPRSADPNVPLEVSEINVSDAIAHLERAVHYMPDDAQTWALLGLAHELIGSADASLAAFDQAVKHGGKHHPDVLLGQAFSAMHHGRFDDVEKLLAAAVKSRPGFVHARGSLGHLYNHFGRSREALAVFQGYARLVPTQPWVLCRLGYTEARLGRHDEAIAHTKAAIAVQPGSAYLYVELASRYIDAGQLDLALEAATKATDIESMFSRAYLRLCYIHLLRNDDNKAIASCEKVVRELGAGRRDLAYAHLNLARAYGHKGRLDDSLSSLARAITLGVPSLAPVEEDPNLAKLRSHRGFRHLIGY